MLAGQYDVTPEDREGLRHSLGLDQPLPLQFVAWLWQIAHLDFGKSFYFNRPVLDLITERIPNSLQISMLALLITVLVGVPLGVVAALRRGRIEDHAIRVLSVVGHAIPQFWLGLIFVLTLGVQARFFPIGSMTAVGVDCGLCWDRFWHLVGPVTVISVWRPPTGTSFMRTTSKQALNPGFAVASQRASRVESPGPKESRAQPFGATVSAQGTALPRSPGAGRRVCLRSMMPLARLCRRRAQPVPRHCVGGGAPV